MIFDPRHSRWPGQRGFTLVEATLAMVLLGAAAAGVLLPFAGGATAQADGAHRTVAALLANDQIERIASTPFADIVTPYDHTEAPGQIKDAGGDIFTNPMYANFSRRTTCQAVWVPPQDDNTGVAPNFVLASVEVCYQGRELATIRRLISQ